MSRTVCIYPTVGGRAVAKVEAAFQACHAYQAEVSTAGGKQYPAFSLEGAVVTFFRSPQHREPIAKLSTINPRLSVFVTLFEESELPSSDSALIELARGLLNRARFELGFEGIVMPVADLGPSGKLSAVDATAAHGSLKMLTIDRPFLFWVECEGFSQPLLVAYVTEEDWDCPDKNIG